MQFIILVLLTSELNLGHLPSDGIASCISFPLTGGSFTFNVNDLSHKLMTYTAIYLLVNLDSRTAYFLNKLQLT